MNRMIKNQMSCCLKKGFFRISVLIVFIQGFAVSSMAQDKFTVTAGTSFPELIHIGTCYRIQKVQIGVSIGTFPLKDERILTLSGNFYYHFGKTPDALFYPPWYLIAGLTYIYDDNKSLTDRFTWLNLKIGRELNFSDRFGINLSAGMIIRMYYSHTRKTTAFFGDNSFNPKFAPALGIDFFYRL